MQNYPYNMQGFNPYQAQQFQHQPIQQTPQSFKLIPVSSKNEVNSFITDFNGTPVYFHNQATNEIYIKQFDIKTGLAKIQEFKHAESDLSHVENESNANIYEKDFKALNERIDGLFDLYSSLKPVEKEGKK